MRIEAENSNRGTGLIQNYAPFSGSSGAGNCASPSEFVEFDFGIMPQANYTFDVSYRCPSVDGNGNGLPSYCDIILNGFVFETQKQMPAGLGIITTISVPHNGGQMLLKLVPNLPQNSFNHTAGFYWVDYAEEKKQTFANVKKTGVGYPTCPVGMSGNAVTYTVPAGTYNEATQALADQKAQDDIDTNKQQYANDNGVCAMSPVIDKPTPALAALANGVVASGNGSALLSGCKFLPSGAKYFVQTFAGAEPQNCTVTIDPNTGDYVATPTGGNGAYNMTFKVLVKESNGDLIGSFDVIIPVNAVVLPFQGGAPTGTQLASQPDGAKVTSGCTNLPAGATFSLEPNSTVNCTAPTIDPNTGAYTAVGTGGNGAYSMSFVIAVKNASGVKIGEIPVLIPVSALYVAPLDTVFDYTNNQEILYRSAPDPSSTENDYTSNIVGFIFIGFLIWLAKKRKKTNG